MTASTPPGILIRPYFSTDRDACLSIFGSNVPKYFVHSEPLEFEAFLAQPNVDFLVAEVDGVVVACGGSYFRDEVGRLCWGMVMQAMHHSSIGTALLCRRVDQLFARFETSEVTIDTSQHSAGFFAHFGFRITQVVTDGFANGIDQVSMSLGRSQWLQRANPSLQPTASGRR